MIGLTWVGIALPAYRSIQFDADAATWTQGLAYDWIRRELPEGTSIRLEGSLALKLPAPYQPTPNSSAWTAPARSARDPGPSPRRSAHGQYFQDPLGISRRIRRLSADLRAGGGGRALRAVSGASGPQLRILKVKQP